MIDELPLSLLESLFTRIDPSSEDNLAIRIASENGHLATIKLLLSDPRVDPAALDNSAVRVAAQNGHVQVLELLLQDSRVDPSADDNDALLAAVDAANFDVVELLLKDPRVDVTVDDDAVFRSACYHGMHEFIDRLLFNKKVNPAAMDNEGIILAAGQGHAEVVDLLLKVVHVDPTAQENAALKAACSNGHELVTSLLLKDGRVDPTVEMNYCIRKAVEAGQLSICKQLLSYEGVNPGDNENEAIRTACDEGHLEIVKMLLADPKVDPSAEANAAVRSASCNGHLDILLLLLQDERVDPSAEDNEAIGAASLNGHLEIVDALLKHPLVDPTFDNYFSLRVAAMNGHLDVVERLLLDKRMENSLMPDLAVDNAVEPVDKVEKIDGEVNEIVDEDLDHQNKDNFLIADDRAVQESEYVEPKAVAIADDGIKRVEVELELQIEDESGAQELEPETVVISDAQAIDSEIPSVARSEQFIEVDRNVEAKVMDSDDRPKHLAPMLETEPDIEGNDVNRQLAAASSSEIVAPRILEENPEISHAPLDVAKGDQEAVSEKFEEIQSELIIAPQNSIESGDELASKSVETSYPLSIPYVSPVILKLALEDPNLDVTSDNDAVFRSACYHGMYEFIDRLLFNKKVNPAAMDNEGIILAAGQGHAEVVDLLLKEVHVDPTAQENAALKAACSNGHEIVTALLLKDGRVNPSFKDNEPIKLALEKGHDEIVKMLLAHPKIDFTGIDTDLVRDAVFDRCFGSVTQEPADTAVSEAECEFRLKADASKVILRGSWDDWRGEVEMGKESHGFVCRMQLQRGRYEYKYVVDDLWMVDPTKPVTGDTLNNVLVLE